MAIRIVIYQDMTLHTKMPFRLAEVFPSIDGGCRTRMTGKCFKTHEEAHEWVIAFEKDEANGD